MVGLAFFAVMIFWPEMFAETMNSSACWIWFAGMVIELIILSSRKRRR